MLLKFDNGALLGVFLGRLWSPSAWTGPSIMTWNANILNKNLLLHLVGLAYVAVVLDEVIYKSAING